MRLFQHLSIDRKVTLITTLVSIGAVVVACTAFITYDLFTARSALIREWSVQTALIGAGNRAALEFGDARAAQEGLDVLAAEPRVLAAYLFTTDGVALAAYRRPDALPTDVPPVPAEPYHLFGLDFLECFELVASEGVTIGTIYMRYDLTFFYERMVRYLSIAALVLLLALGVGYLLSVRLKGYLTGPILHLAETARTISHQKDYSVRAQRRSHDELGLLVDGFNEMLREIQHRDAVLASHRDALEVEVAIRTAELEQTNQALAEARDRAEAASRLKSALLNSMSHEFRTPIAGILGLTDVLAEEVAPDQQEFITLLRQSGERLQSTLTAVLEMADLESGTRALHPESFAACSASAEIAEGYQAEAQRRGLAFHVDCASPLPVCLDRAAFRIVIDHLLHNAFKFTEAGTISLVVQPDGDHLALHVQDSGVGIDAETLPTLFEPFRQASMGLTRTHEGMGMGLAIVRRLVALQGGTVAVQSTPGKGTTFTIRLPRTAARPISDRAAQPPAAHQASRRPDSAKGTGAR